MTRHRSTQHIQQILHEGCFTFETETVIKFVELGADPLWRDQNGISCVDRALAHKNGNKSINKFINIVLY